MPVPAKTVLSSYFLQDAFFHNQRQHPFGVAQFGGLQTRSSSGRLEPGRTRNAVPEVRASTAE
mgnify:CR=1 FL=1